MAFDSSPAVLVLIAHDPSLPKYLPAMNHAREADLNTWQKEDWKALCRWDWLKAGQDNAGSKSVGFWRDGSIWSDARHQLAAKCAGVAGTGL